MYKEILNLRKATVVFNIIILVIISTLSGCGNDNSDTYEVDVALEQKVESNDEEQITLTLWHIWTTDTDNNKVTLYEAVERFEKSHPNIKLEIEATETESYKTKLKTAIAAGEAPDVFFSWGGGFSQSFVEAEKVLKLDGYISQATREQLIPTAFDNQTYNGSIYGVPFMLSYAVLFCNTELFDKYGLNYPETYDDLLKAVDVFNDNKIIPMSVAQKDLWPGMFHYNLLALREAGADTCYNALTGAESFEQEAFINAADKMSELVELEAFSPLSHSQNYDQAMAEFKYGESAMVLQGSWAVGGFDVPELPIYGKVKPMKFPVVEGGQGTKTEFLGGAVDCFMASAMTKHPDEAALAVQEIAKYMSIEGYRNGMSIPVWNADSVGDDEVSSLFKETKALADDATAFIMWWDTFLRAEEAGIHLNLVGEIFAGSIDSNKFVEEMEKLND